MSRKFIPHKVEILCDVCEKEIEKDKYGEIKVGCCLSMRQYVRDIFDNSIFLKPVHLDLCPDCGYKIKITIDKICQQK